MNRLQDLLKAESTARERLEMEKREIEEEMKKNVVHRSVDIQLTFTVCHYQLKLSSESSQTKKLQCFRILLVTG